MGKEVDLTGQRFGQLYVHSLIGLVQHGRNKIKVWLCVCDCSEKLKCRQDDLKKGIVQSCNVCRRGPCVICGKAITDKTYSVKRNTCSDECKKEQRRCGHRKRYRTLFESDPNHNKNRYTDRIAKDPYYNKKRYSRKIILRRRLPKIEQQRRKEVESKQCNEWRKRWIEVTKNNDPEKYEAYRVKANKNFRSCYKRKQQRRVPEALK